VTKYQYTYNFGLQLRADKHLIFSAFSTLAETYSISKSVYIKNQKVRDDLLSRNGGRGIPRPAELI
jgi:hypothetical protein